jgi:hypothetical protein
MGAVSGTASVVWRRASGPWSSLDGRRSLTDVVVATGLGAFEACALVYRLARLGAVETDVP